MASRLLAAPWSGPVALAASFAAVLAACGGADGSPPAAPSSPTAAATAARPAGKPSLVELGAVAAAGYAALEPVTSLPEAPGRFEPVALPAGTPAIVAVAGRRADDVWMLGARGTVLRWDGARLTDEGAPRCFTDTCCGKLFDCKRFPAKCSASAPPCKIGQWDCASEVVFQGLRVAAGEIVAVATIDTGGITTSTVESRRGADGRWSCEQPARDGLVRADLTHAAPSVVLEQQAFFGPNRLGDHGLVVEGRRLTLPNELSMRNLGLVARAPHDLWLWVRGDADGARLWHGNGLSWQPVAVPLAGIADVWPAGPGAMWVLGMASAGIPGMVIDLPGTVFGERLVHLEPGAPSPRVFAVPGATRRLQGTGDTFWLVGKTAAYRWDGRALSRTDIPLDFAGEEDHVVQAQDPVWSDPSGALWVVGAHRTAKVKTPDGPVPAGAAFRFSFSLAEKKP